MRAAFALDQRSSGSEADFRASFPEPAAHEPVAFVPPPAPSPYGTAAGPNWSAIVTVLAVHVLLLIALVKFDVIEVGKKAPPPLVVDLLGNTPTPPPVPTDPKPEVAPVKPVTPRIVAPPALVQTPAPPPQVAIVAEAPPPQAVIVAPPAPKAAAVSAPVSVDLSTKMVAGKPPRYPTESRRAKEQGTVVLRLLLGVDGSVAEIALAHSSGFDRLDKAALDAVKHWRWSPTMQAGQAMQVRGTVEIPFVLQG